MGTPNSKRVLLILPKQLLALTDEAAELLQISRLGFIRQAIALRLASFRPSDKDAMKVIDVVEASKLRQTMSDGCENWFQKEQTETQPTAEKKPLKYFMEWWKERW